MDVLRYGSLMLLAGIGIPLLAVLNAQLGMRIASPVAAATVLFAVAFAASLVALLVTRSSGALAQVPSQPSHLLLAGLFVVFYVLAVTWVAPRFGVGNAIFCVLLGQLLSAAMIDKFGLFGAMVKPLDGMRLAGLLIMAVGVAVTQLAARG